MSNIVLIESGPFETRVAVLEHSRLAEVHIERPSAGVLVGSIYKGRVSRVIPGIQAAFVKIGLERDAFLFASDLERSEFSQSDDDAPSAGRGRNQQPIADVVQSGEELLVQVVKEPLHDKGARISLQISLPGRYLVLLPGGSGVRISRRIEDPEKRQHLEAVLRDRLPENTGIIVRTAAVDGSLEELLGDLEGLQCQWRHLRARAAVMRAPAPIHEEQSLAVRTLRDLVHQSIEAVWVEGRDGYDELIDHLADMDPGMVDILHLHEGEPSLFDRFKIDDGISKAMRRRVWLSSGGFIVIDPTEALVAIDVNSGRNTEGAELEETALQTNLEAVTEVAREIRLRDLTGIIVVDFIDMIESEHRAEVIAALEEALASDRSRTQISQMSDFGLVAITRKRMRGGLRQQLTERCPCCAGNGRIKDPLTVGLELQRAIRRRLGAGVEARTTVRVHSRVKSALEIEFRELWDAIRHRSAGEIVLQAADDLRLDEFDIRTDE